MGTEINTFHHKNDAQKGFTIVELLIVIVVIGILAAITIVAFNGVQQRSQVASAKSASAQVNKALEAYHITAGVYPNSLADINVSSSSTTSYLYTSFDSGAAACVSAQTGASIYSVQSNSAPIQGGCGQVVASYYPNTTLAGESALVRSEVAMDNVWVTSSPGSPIPVDNFSALFKAKIIPPVSGAYTFYTTTDDAAQLSIDGISVLDWTVNAREAVSTTVNLVANQPTTVAYSMVENGGNAYASLGWSYPGQTRIVVPASAFRRI